MIQIAEEVGQEGSGVLGVQGHRFLEIINDRRRGFDAAIRFQFPLEDIDKGQEDGRLPRVFNRQVTRQLQHLAVFEFRAPLEDGLDVQVGSPQHILPTFETGVSQGAVNHNLGDIGFFAKAQWFCER